MPDRNGCLFQFTSAVANQPPPRMVLKYLPGQMWLCRLARQCFRGTFDVIPLAGVLSGGLAGWRTSAPTVIPSPRDPSSSAPLGAPAWMIVPDCVWEEQFGSCVSARSVGGHSARTGIWSLEFYWGAAVSLLLRRRVVDCLAGARSPTFSWAAGPPG